MLIVLICAVGSCTSNADDGPNRPPITRLLDASAYADRPCSLLSDDQATRLGYPKPDAEIKAEPSSNPEDSMAAYCRRTSPSMDFSLYLARDELDVQYRRSKDKTIAATGEPWLEPSTIAGQPAAVLGRSRKEPNIGCDVVVGLTDTQGLRVHAAEHDNGGRGDGKACEYAIGVAEVIVRTLGG